MKHIEFIIPEWSVAWFANSDSSSMTDEEVDLLESFQVELLTLYGTAHLHSFEEYEDFGYNEVDHFLGKTYKATLTRE